jgi:GrpB-like predicted nucleotidyltransferase (UPF0157 family)
VQLAVSEGDHDLEDRRRDGTPRRLGRIGDYGSLIRARYNHIGYIYIRYGKRRQGGRVAHHSPARPTFRHAGERVMNEGGRRAENGGGVPARPIGLARGTVRVVDWDPHWPALFEDEARRLEAAVRASGLPPLAFEHVGSTSIHGLAAKPIIDMMAGYRDRNDARLYAPVLVEAGYEPRGPQGVPERELYVFGAESLRTHHLNVVAADGAFWREHLLFRDRLRHNSALVREYADLKRLLAVKHGGDRGAYTCGKAAFVRRVLHG